MELCQNDLFTKEMDRLNIGVSYASYVTLEPGWSFAGENPSFTRIYYIISGKGVIRCQGRTFPMEGGNIYILPAGTDFSYTIHTTMEKVYFHINLLRNDRYDVMQSMQNCIVLSNRQAEIQQVLSCIQQNERVFSALQLKQSLWNTLVEVLTLTHSDPGSIEQYSPLVQKALKYVETNLHSGMTSAEIAAALFVSDSKLRKSFRKEVDVPLGRYINDQLLFTAERELRLTDKPIKEISAALGFCDPFYFSRVFSARYGISPAEYRKISI